MKAHYFTILLIAVMINFFNIGCKKETKSNAPDTKVGEISGMGDSKEPLKGNTFNLPDGITLEMQKVSFESNANYCQVKGSGIFVSVGFLAANHNKKDTTLILPAGLTFHSMDNTVQNGLLLQETKIMLPQNSVCNTLLNLYCVNQHRHATDETSIYELGPITDAQPLIELMKLVKDKQIESKAKYDPDNYSIISRLQTAVWHITNSDGLTQEDRNYINSIQ